tara:strand:- start:1467 stop:2141 length:675 start_codon:yes stop_codon:yes gene_type:complete
MIQYITVVCIILLVLYLCCKNTIEGLENKSTLSDDMKKEINEYIKDNINYVGPQGIRGERGPPGDVGKSGGTFIEKGILQSDTMYNEKDNLLYVAAMSGTGPSSKLYHSNSHFNPFKKNNSVWTYDSKNNIKTATNRCMTKNKDNDIYVSTCSNSSSNQRWLYHKNRTITPFGDNKNCLSVNKDEIDSVKLLGKGKNKGAIKLVNLQPCKSATTSPTKWIFKSL